MGKKVRIKIRDLRNYMTLGLVESNANLSKILPRSGFFPIGASNLFN